MVAVVAFFQVGLISPSCGNPHQHHHQQIDHKVYKALIRSVIDYGCIAYDTASATTKARLDVIQAKAPRFCCGAMVGTPTSAVQVECGQPPLALRRLRMAADYAVK